MHDAVVQMTDATRTRHGEESNAPAGLSIVTAVHNKMF